MTKTSASGKVHGVEEVTPREHYEEERDERQVDEPVNALRGADDQLEVEIVVKILRAARRFLSRDASEQLVGPLVGHAAQSSQ